MMSLFEEAARCSDRAEQARTMSEHYRDPICVRTMQGLAEYWDRRAALAATRAIALEHYEASKVQSKSGLHPYRAALFFILREIRNKHHTSRKARATVVAGDYQAISNWPMVRLVAHSFGKMGTDVARDLIETERALEDGGAL